ncbi:hypothetical protein RJ527_14365 [Thalassospiraceae bacterium LMO-SO8]|nr:hypothetical protein [Alphaproteobacteria bacterium LMO-S08]WND75208.1 hypothetical protein RJ527_14365 [Thalassospiraceae bacterium LMO-SO8]
MVEIGLAISLLVLVGVLVAIVGRQYRVLFVAPLLLIIGFALPITTATLVGAQNVKVGKDEHLSHGWDFYTSHTECGGLRRDGKPQPPCKSKHAIYEGPALGSCPAGSIFDIGLWQCWSCPGGFTRTAAAVDTDRACARQATWQESNVKQRFKPATKLGDLCPGPTAQFEKAFYDSIRGGECWSCPKGYETNVLPRVDAWDKCTRPSSEELRRPTRMFNTLWPHDCKPGQFHDAWDGGACWQCPSGFVRTAHHVNSTSGCSRAIPAASARATVRGIAKCEAGTITDPRNGGECWKCPETYDRVLLNPITSPQACETTPGLVVSKAKFVSALTCPAGQHFDFIKVDNTFFNNMKTAGITSPRAKPAPDGGTCWSCPAEHTRTYAPVYNHDACQGPTTEWYAAPFGEPGLFRLPGADDVVLEILRDDRKKLDAAIREMVRSCAENKDDLDAARNCKQNPEKEVAEAWAEIEETPGVSSILMNMVFGRIELAAANPSQVPSDARKVTAADKRLLASFADYVKNRRIYVAEEALKAFDAWRTAEAYWKKFAENSTSGLITTNGKSGGPDLTQVKPADEPTPPPDWHEIVQAATIASVSGLTVIAGGTMVAVATNPTLKKLVRPNYGIRQGIKKKVVEGIKEGGGELAKKTTKLLTKSPVDDVAGKVALKGLNKALSKGASSVFKFLKAAGPAFVITAIIEVVIEVATKMDEYSKTDRGHLLAMLAHAKQTPDLTRDFQTEERRSVLEGYWLLAMSGLSDPAAHVMSRIKSYAQGKEAATQLTNVTAPTTVIMQGDPVVTPLNTGNTPSQKIQGQTIPVINETASLQPGRGNDWEQIPGRAHDIALATDGTVWVIGDNKVPGGNGIYFRGPKDRDWKSAPGGAVRIAVADTTPWLVNDGGIAFERAGTTWANRPVLAGGKIMKAVDIGASAKGVWAVAEPTKQGSFAVYRWTGKQWLRDQSAWGTRITVDRDGNPWLTNAAGQIFALVNGKWQPFNGTAQDIAVDAFGVPVVVDASGKVMLFDAAANKWMTTGRDATAVAVGGGKIWHLGPKTEVYRQK